MATGWRQIKMLPAAMLMAVAMLIAGERASIAQTATSAAAPASSSHLKTLLAHLQRHYQETDSFQAKFKETVTRTGAPPRDRTGVIYYRKPGRLRWEFQEPQPETIVSDGSLIYDYDPGLNQVVETPLKSAFKSQGVAAFLLGVGNLGRDFKASSVASAPADGLEHLALTPKGGGDRIELGVDPQSYNIMTLALTDSLGNRTQLQFSGFQRNLELDPKLFAFTVPAGADIVKPGSS